MKGSRNKNNVISFAPLSKEIHFIYQADFDAVHHELEDVLLEALLAGRRQGEGGGGVGDGGGAALIVGRLVAPLGREEVVVRRVGDVEQVEQILTHVCRGEVK